MYPSGSRWLLIQQGLHAQADFAFFIHLQDLDPNNLTFLDVVAHVVDPLVGDLRDMKQAVAAGNQIHDGSKVEDSNHRPLIDAAHLHLRRDLLDPGFGSLCAFSAYGGNDDIAVILDLSPSPPAGPESLR